MYADVREIAVPEVKPVAPVSWSVRRVVGTQLLGADPKVPVQARGNWNALLRPLHAAAAGTRIPAMHLAYLAERTGLDDLQGVAERVGGTTLGTRSE